MQYIIDTPIQAFITALMGLAAGVAITALYCLGLFRENNEMRNSLGRPQRTIFKK